MIAFLSSRGDSSARPLRCQRFRHRDGALLIGSLIVCSNRDSLCTAHSKKFKPATADLTASFMPVPGAQNCRRVEYLAWLAELRSKVLEHSWQVLPKAGLFQSCEGRHSVTSTRYTAYRWAAVVPLKYLSSRNLPQHVEVQPCKSQQRRNHQQDRARTNGERPNISVCTVVLERTAIGADFFLWSTGPMTAHAIAGKRSCRISFDQRAMPSRISQ